MLALGLSFVLTPYVRRLAIRYKAIDTPGDPRRIHSKPIPRWGGLAIYAAFAVVVLLNFHLSRQIMGLLGGVTILLVVNTVLQLLTVDLIREIDLGDHPSSEFARAYTDLAKMAVGAVTDNNPGLVQLAAYLSRTGWLQETDWHDCQERDCRRLEHAVNETDWADSSSSQSRPVPASY